MSRGKVERIAARFLCVGLGVGGMSLLFAQSGVITQKTNEAILSFSAAATIAVVVVTAILLLFFAKKN